MKVVQLSKYYPPAVGGIENNVQQVAHMVASRGGESVVIASNHDSRSRGVVLERDGPVTVLRLPTLGRILSLPLTMGWFRTLRRHSRGAVIHLHSPNPLAEVACLIGAGENPLVVTDHGLVRADRPGSALRGILYRAVLRKSRRIITYTQAFALTNPDLALFPERLCIIPPAINVADFERTPRVGAKAQEIRGKDPSPILLFVGRIVHYKGLDTLLDAFDRLDAPARLLIVGDGPELARLKERTKSLTRGRHVDFVGEVPRDQIAPYYYAAHVLVLPALTAQESFSQAVLEAAICGIPAIGTRVGSGLEELIGDQKGGLVVPPGDSRALAAALGELLRDDETRLRLGSGARRRALERYAPAAVEEMLIHLYAEVAPN